MLKKIATVSLAAGMLVPNGAALAAPHRCVAQRSDVIDACYITLEATVGRDPIPVEAGVGGDIELCTLIVC